MSRFDITRSCGHVEVVNIGGPYRDRDRQAAYQATRLCAECFRAKAKAEFPEKVLAARRAVALEIDTCRAMIETKRAEGAAVADCDLATACISQVASEYAALSDYDLVRRDIQRGDVTRRVREVAEDARKAVA